MRSKYMVEEKISSDEIEEIECEKCKASVKLANPDVNRCQNCGVEYDGIGELITESFGCDFECCVVYLTSKERNVCESGLAYDGEGKPIASEPAPGTYIGWRIAGLDGMGAGEEHYYVYPNGDGTWTLHRHARHPDVNDERGPYDADELLEALK